MARFHIAAALVTATIALLVISHLLSTYGNSTSDFLHVRYGSSSYDRVDHQHVFDANEEHTELKDGATYLLGVGKADITGPVVEINMMGYADPNQVGSGLRQRLYSRAFIIGDVDKPEDRFVYLVLDAQSGDTAVRYGILEGLAELGEVYHVYGQNNVAVTGTHSHSGPGAWLNYLLPQITSKGFDTQSYQAIVDGALLSIKRAHQSLRPGTLSVGEIEVKDANINRSPYAYLANPEEERRRYKDDVDKSLTMLLFKDATYGKSLGVLTFFAVHGTSMLGNNTLITGDNKGVAAHLLEQSIRGTDSANSGFVAAFSQANVGDTSPNILGAYCEDSSGSKCNFKDSTCGGKTQACHGRGPRFREKDRGASSCFEIGKRQFLAAKDLYSSMLSSSTSASSTPIIGNSVKSLHTFHDFSNHSFIHPNGINVSTCPAALGYSFAAGTTDGPGAFDFTQNNTDGHSNANPLWSLVSGAIHAPGEEQKACQYPKPILLDVGETKRPYAWTPNIVDIQLLRVGQLIIIVSPGEATTMAGRRWRSAIHTAAKESFPSVTEGIDPMVLLGGPANTYTHYITTEEEYAIQRYEGASTLYGPHTLNAHISLTSSLLPYLSPDSTSHPPPGPDPPIHINSSLSFITPVAYDRSPLFKSFGDIVTPPKLHYKIGETVQVSFVGANPRNDLRLEDAYASVEKLDRDGIEWKRVRDDSDWDLIFHWRRTSSVLGTSEVDVEWVLDEDFGIVEKGTYRIRYFGSSKAFGSGTVTPFEGSSEGFEIG
ncbi:hypothetical protein ACLMJK_000557 [Lecanora helva]